MKSKYNTKSYTSLSADLSKSLIDKSVDAVNFNFFQSPIFFDLAREIKFYSPYLFMVRDDQNRITASLLALLIQESSGVKGVLSRRVVIYGSPVFYRDCNKETVISLLLEDVNKELAKRSVFTQIRSFYDLSEYKAVFQKKKYAFQERLNLLLDTRDKDTLWKQMSESRRRQIRKSREAGSGKREAGSLDEVEVLYKMLYKLYKYKVHKPLPDWSFFKYFYEKIHGTAWGKIFVVWYKDDIVGGIFSPITPGKTVYELYICGMDKEYQKYGIYPSVMATWASIEYALNSNIPQFDFMGVGLPNRPYGVREFKRRFGGEMVNYGRYTRINNKLLFKVAEVGYNVLSLFNKV